MYLKIPNIYQRLYVNFLSSSQKHIRWISEKLSNLLNIRGDLSFRKRNGHYKYTKTVWGLRFAKRDSLKLLSWLYYKPNLPCLHRKRRIAERFLEILNN